MISFWISENRRKSQTWLEGSLFLNMEISLLSLLSISPCIQWRTELVLRFVISIRYMPRPRTATQHKNNVTTTLPSPRSCTRSFYATTHGTTNILGVERRKLKVRRRRQGAGSREAVERGTWCERREMARADQCRCCVMEGGCCVRSDLDFGDAGWLRRWLWRQWAVADVECEV